MIRHLYYFLTVAEELHFGRAAERLGLTQPPLSAQIKVLEHVLGVELFERSRAGVRLTRHGEAILPSVRRMIKNAEQLESIVHLAKAGQLKTLIIGAVTSAMFSPLGDMINRARTELPQMSVSIREMDTSEAIRALEAGEIDLAFVRTEMVAKPLVCQPLVKENLVLAVWPEHSLAKKREIRFSDLDGEGLVMCPRSVSAEYFDSIYRCFRNEGVILRAPHIANSIVSQIAMTACRVGVAIVPNSFTGFESARVVYREILPASQVVTAAAVWNERRHSREIREFIALAGV